MRSFFIIAFLVRLALVAYGNYHDQYHMLKYTDVDYSVVTDAARFVHEAGSPFDRPTFRYTPLLAWSMLPNIWLNESWGKILFCLGDLLCAMLIYRILTRAVALSQRQALVYTAVFLFNPLTVNVSTRGNAESLVCLCVLLTVDAVLSRKIALAGLLLGLSVHVKLYPVLYSLPIFLHLLRSPKFINENNADKAIESEGNATDSPHSSSSSSSDAVGFTLAALTSFLSLTAFFFWLYGWPFLDASLLYHIRRVDARHNFSLFFYPSYLDAVTAAHSESVSLLLRLLPIIPQAVVTIVISLRFHTTVTRLLFGLFLQTFTFVAFNRVCTVQYFLWWLALLPLTLPQMLAGSARWSRRAPLLVSLGVWAAAHVLWGNYAYQLEFEGQNRFLEVWASSVLIFLANIAMTAVFIVLFDDKGANKMKLN